MNLNELQADIHKNAVDHGWWEQQPTLITETLEKLAANPPYEVPVQRTFGDCIALCHSELSEALEAFRDNGIKASYSYKTSTNQYGEKSFEVTDSKPEGAFVELADCVIRILDMAGFYGVDMQAVIEEKHEYNKTRPFRHGGKKL